MPEGEVRWTTATTTAVQSGPAGPQSPSLRRHGSTGERRRTRRRHHPEQRQPIAFSRLRPRINMDAAFLIKICGRNGERLGGVHPSSPTVLFCSSTPLSRRIYRSICTPRLGVGAPIPEGASTSRETANLKKKLSGTSNKRSREEDTSFSASSKKDDRGSDDDEESRAGALSKKARLNGGPLGVFEGKKKKKKKGNGKDKEDMVSSGAGITSPTQSLLFSAQYPSPRPQSAGDQPPPSPTQSSPKMANSNPTPPLSPPKARAPSSPSKGPISNQDALKIPLLNLNPSKEDDEAANESDEPVEHIDQEGTAAEKKKKKRKRKKKKGKKDPVPVGEVSNQ